jgi:transcriptional regulator with XRE-family HTH domain
LSIEPQMSDKAILAEIGHRLGRRRVALELTQADLAREAGVAKRTVERIEAGASTQLATLIRMLRVLELFGTLEQLIPEPGPSPMELLKLRGKERQRASSKRHAKAAEKEWSWGDEE